MTLDFFSIEILLDGSYYLSIPNALVNCPLHVLIIMLMFNIVAIYKDWNLNKKIFETYRSSITDIPTIDPLNEVQDDQLKKEQCSTDSKSFSVVLRRLFVRYLIHI